MMVLERVIPALEKKERMPDGTRDWNFLDMGCLVWSGVVVRVLGKWGEVVVGDCGGEGKRGFGGGKRRGMLESWRRCCSRMRERWI